MHTHKLKLIGNLLCVRPCFRLDMYINSLPWSPEFVFLLYSCNHTKVLSCFFTWHKKFNVVLHFFIDLKSIHGIRAEIPFILRLNPRLEGSWLSLITYIKKEYDSGEVEVSLRSLEIEDTKAIIGSSYQMVCWRNENLSQYTFVFV